MELLGKEININKMNSKNIQDEIDKTQNLIEQLISEGKYPKAEEANKKVEILKKIYKEKRQ